MGNKPSLPPPTLDDFKDAFDPKKNGLDASIKRTNDNVAQTNKDFATSVAKTQKTIDEQNKYIGDKLQSNLKETKSRLDNNLEKTRNEVDMRKLQEATGVIVKIANLNPIGFVATEAINAGTNGDSNRWLNNSDSSNNPLLDVFSGIFENSPFGGGGNNDKKLEEPTTIQKSPPTTTIEPSTEPYSKYAQFDGNPTISKDKTDNTELYVTLGVVAVGVTGLLILAKNKT